MTTWHDRYTEARSVGDKVADMLSTFVGSWWFVIIHAVWFSFWVIFNVEPFPYGLLTLIVSLEAIFLSTFIMMSSNRQSDRDRHQADADYETNVRAKRMLDALLDFHGVKIPDD